MKLWKGEKADRERAKEDGMNKRGGKGNKENEEEQITDEI